MIGGCAATPGFTITSALVDTVEVPVDTCGDGYCGYGANRHCDGRPLAAGCQYVGMLFSTAFSTCAALGFGGSLAFGFTGTLVVGASPRMLTSVSPMVMLHSAYSVIVIVFTTGGAVVGLAATEGAAVGRAAAEGFAAGLRVTGGAAGPRFGGGGGGGTRTVARAGAAFGKGGTGTGAQIPLGGGGMRVVVCTVVVVVVCTAVVVDLRGVSGLGIGLNFASGRGDTADPLPYVCRNVLISLVSHHFAYEPFPGQGGPAGVGALYGAFGGTIPLPPLPLPLSNAAIRSTQNSGSSSELCSSDITKRSASTVST